MSVYANATIARRFPGFVLPKRSLSHEMKAVLAGGTVWAVLLGIVALQEVPDAYDMQSSTNLTALQIDLPDADTSVPVRQHY
ncbi:MAG: hypothetical protein ABJF50_13825 [Paracoccaceae bacterium]